jgi:hypothetical protein
MGPHKECTDTDPELFAGEPVDDGWHDETQDGGDDDGGELDSGAVPGQPQD